MALVQVRRCDRCKATAGVDPDDPGTLPDSWRRRPLPVSTDEVEEMELCGDCDRKLIQFAVNRRTNPATHTCELCPGFSGSAQKVQAHRRTAHPPEPRPEEPPVRVATGDAPAWAAKLNPGGAVLGCEDCDFMTHGAVSLNDHAKEAHNRRATREERTPLSGRAKVERFAAVGVEVAEQ